MFKDKPIYCAAALLNSVTKLLVSKTFGLSLKKKKSCCTSLSPCLSVAMTMLMTISPQTRTKIFY